MGIDEVGIDKVGIDEVGINQALHGENEKGVLLMLQSMPWQYKYHGIPSPPIGFSVTLHFI